MKLNFSASTVILCLCLVLGGGCGIAGGTGPHVRVATATPAQLEALKDQDNVWYEFQPGDIIPVQLAFFGVMEGGPRGLAAFRAKKLFYFVMSKNQPMRISFDGKTFAGPQSSQTILAVVPNDRGPGGKLAWVLYMGESGQPEQELKEFLSKKQSSAPPP